MLTDNNVPVWPLRIPHRMPSYIFKASNASGVYPASFPILAENSLDVSPRFSFSARAPAAEETFLAWWQSQETRGRSWSRKQGLVLRRSRNVERRENWLSILFESNELMRQVSEKPPPKLIPAACSACRSLVFSRASFPRSRARFEDRFLLCFPWRILRACENRV